VLIKGGVLLDEILFVLGNILQRVNRVRSAGWDTSAAVYAAFRIHVHLRCGFEAGLILLGMDAIGWADFDAEGIFDASVRNYISHDESISSGKWAFLQEGV
jgi:hypothetical protein